MRIQWQGLIESYSNFLALSDRFTRWSPTRILSKDGRGQYFELITSSSVLSLFNLKFVTRHPTVDISNTGLNLSDRISLIIPTERIERQIQLSNISIEMIHNSERVTDRAPRMLTKWALSLKYDLNQARGRSQRPKRFANLSISLVWSTVSKAAERSNKSKITVLFLSTSRTISLKTLTKAVISANIHPPLRRISWKWWEKMMAYLFEVSLRSLVMFFR